MRTKYLSFEEAFNKSFIVTKVQLQNDCWMRLDNPSIALENRDNTLQTMEEKKISCCIRWKVKQEISHDIRAWFSFIRKPWSGY